MKGSEVIDLWRAANNSVNAICAKDGEELGDRIVDLYNPSYNGWCVCIFREKKHTLWYSAELRLNQMKLESRVLMNASDQFTPICEIEPDKDYAVESF